MIMHIFQQIDNFVCWLLCLGCLTDKKFGDNQMFTEWLTTLARLSIVKFFKRFLSGRFLPIKNEQSSI